MRMTELLLKTQKQMAAEPELPSHLLLLRAGLIRRTAPGVYSLTPLALRAIRRIEAIVREEMDLAGGQELLLPATSPGAVRDESDRYGATTSAAAVTDLVGAVVDSYRQLPQLLYQIQTQVRDEPRPRGGLIRLREFLMKEAYSFHTSDADLDLTYDRVVEAYLQIFRRVGVPVLVAESDPGLAGGCAAHGFMLQADGGEERLVVCPFCGYAAHQAVALAARSPGPQGEPEPIKEIHTPGVKTIADLCRQLAIGPEQTLKAVFYTTGDELVLVMIRGDLDVSDVKLRNLLGKEVRTLSPVESAEAGFVVGATGPVGLKVKVRLVVDDSVLSAANLVTGANRVDYHLGGINYGRDFTADVVGEIALAAPGAACPHCGAPLEARWGIEAGKTYKLGASASASYTDEAGATRPLVMGRYAIGISRLLACVIEQNHDGDGIIWPAAVAPYPYHLLVAGKDPEPARLANELYGKLGPGEVLYDNRDISPGVKFKDADLLGMPVRITLSGRSLAAGGAELRHRRTGESRVVPLAEVPAAAHALLTGNS